MSLGSRFIAAPPSRRVQWWVSFGLFTALIAAWTLSSPLMAGPDEPAHTIRAVSLARGELVGPTRPEQPDHVRYVDVPTAIARTADLPTCFAFKPDVPAGCAPSMNEGPDGMQEMLLTHGRYPPTPFGVVGLASLIDDSSAGVYLMRLLGAVIIGALFASALASLRQSRAPWLGASGLAFALTPMVLFMGSVVNPSGLEIAGGVAFWASGVVLLGQAREGVVDSRVVARTAIGAAVLVLARPLGVGWLAVATAVLLLTGSGPALARLLRRRVVQAWAAVVAVCIAFELAWITSFDALGSKSPPGPSAEGLSNLEVLRTTLGTTRSSVREMIGLFGWIDTPVPPSTVVLWTAALGLLVGLGVGLGRARMAVAITALLGLIVVVPALLEFVEARRFGFGWQGRYTLPFAVGLPILCGYTLAQEPERILPRGRLTIVLGSAFVVAQFLAFWQNLRRYTVGYDGQLDFWNHADWSPPLPSLLLLIAYTVVLVALAVWLWGWDRAAVRTGTTSETPQGTVEAEPGPVGVSTVTA